MQSLRSLDAALFLSEASMLPVAKEAEADEAAGALQAEGEARQMFVMC